ncbi:GNAT family N-acetyltransferase [Pseudanabaena sp. FACHB-2040]|uniref:GNAT family N-acetyltransferase n=1 Tax=Pseudanabaena sp. FACHB-2040 TaxID=2692859 RepID=UPI0016823CFE|nr:GNAT family N-acetyltransferase [Pseudanabaena sp. FACHB-2040]MBD2256061.1 GNAT family N-acetyltransferase [Pseudanabaena sp. FACHB-2040]
MSQQTYLKVPFAWEEPKPLIEVPPRLTYEPAIAVPNNLLISVVGRVMASSTDPSYQKQVSRHGPEEAAEIFLSAARDGFSCQDEWWQFGINENGDIVGFVLPVIFEGCAKAGLEEGTIYGIGVLPEYRGFGFANDLLSKGTQTLQEVGVWQVFCDTGVENVRMISTFKRVGYRQYGKPWERPI